MAAAEREFASRGTYLQCCLQLTEVDVDLDGPTADDWGATRLDERGSHAP